MRPKRPKLKESPGRSRANAGKARRGRYPQREFGRQIDADLTETAGSSAGHNAGTSIFEDSAGFSGAEFPDIDPGENSPAQKEAPAITQSVVRERAMRLLVHREHGRKELAKKLLQRELPQDLIDSVLDQLAEEGLQCDIRFAESYTRMRVDRGYGANKVRADLQSRGLDQSVVEDAIRDSGADWTAIASNALSKKFEGSKLETREFDGSSAVSAKTRARMQRYLYQRGFDAEQIRSAMTEFAAVHP